MNIKLIIFVLLILSVVFCEYILLYCGYTTAAIFTSNLFVVAVVFSPTVDALLNESYVKLPPDEPQN